MMLCPGITQNQDLSRTFRKDIIQTTGCSGFLCKVQMSNYPAGDLIKYNDHQEENKNPEKLFRSHYLILKLQRFIKI